VKKRGILSNARVHLGQKVVLRLDIRRFFESISLQQVKSALQAGGLDEDSALLLGRCTTLDGYLPVGFSTSPFLANLVFDPTDSVLRSFASEHSLNYTRYVALRSDVLR
jgi:RNA-directed DNA polymerase